MADPFPFLPDEAKEDPLTTVDDLVEANPVDASTAADAADEWRDDPPDDEFENLLDAEEVD